MKSNKQGSISMRRVNIWRRYISLLVAMVLVMGNVLPATSLGVEASCGKTEHTHTEECYTPETKVSCGKEETEGHAHGDSCYKFTTTQICTMEESEGHKHNDGCKTITYVPGCGVEVGAGAHEHDAACYENVTAECLLEESAGHVHTDACNETKRELTCADTTEGHTHADACYTDVTTTICGKTEGEGAHKHNPETGTKTESVLKCGLEANPGHQHTDACNVPQEEITCTLEESEGHTHGEGCTETTKELICQEAEVEAHVHSDACNTTEKIPTCGQEEHDHAEDCYPVSETDAPRDGEPVYMGEYIQHVTVENRAAGTAEWKTIADKVADSAADLTVADTDELKITIEYKIPGASLTGTTAIDYKLPLKSNEAVLQAKEEVIYALDKVTAIGKAVTGIDGTVTITFDEAYLEANDNGTEIIGTYQFLANANELNFSEEGAAVVNFLQDETNPQAVATQLSFAKAVEEEVAPIDSGDPAGTDEGEADNDSTTSEETTPVETPVEGEDEAVDTAPEEPTPAESPAEGEGEAVDTAPEETTPAEPPVEGEGEADNDSTTSEETTPVETPVEGEDEAVDTAPEDTTPVVEKLVTFEVPTGASVTVDNVDVSTTNFTAMAKNGTIYFVVQVAEGYELDNVKVDREKDARIVEPVVTPGEYIIEGIQTDETVVTVTVTVKEVELSDRTENVEVYASYTDGTAATGTKLHVNDTLEATDVEKISQAIKNTLAANTQKKAAIYPFDINFTDMEENDVTLEKEVTVEVLLSENAVKAEGNSWAVYHINAEDVAEEVTNVTYETVADDANAISGFTFTASEFSPYVLTEVVQENVVTFNINEGAKILVNGVDVATTGNTAMAENGTIYFDIEVEEGYELVQVLMDNTTELTADETTGQYRIGNIQTNNTIVAVTTKVEETQAASETETDAPETESKIQGYLDEIAVLKAEAEALDPEAEDLWDQCYTIYENVMAVMDAATLEWEESLITDEEYETVMVPGLEVQQYLADTYGFDPYATDVDKKEESTTAKEGTFKHIEIEVAADATVTIDGVKYTEDLTISTSDTFTITAKQGDTVFTLGTDFKYTGNTTGDGSVNGATVELTGEYPTGTQDNPVKYTVSVTRNVTFYLRDSDGNMLDSNGNIVTDATKAVVVATLPITLTVEVNYWMKNNYCPGICTATTNNNVTTYDWNDNWEAGYFVNGSGIDYPIHGDAGNLIITKGKLMITKSIVDNTSDTTSFTFYVQDSTGKYVVFENGAYKELSATLTDACYVSVAAGSGVTLTDFPEGGYKVTEIQQNGYIIANVNGSNTSTNYSTDFIQVTKDDESIPVAAFKNKKLTDEAGISIAKTASGLGTNYDYKDPSISIYKSSDINDDGTIKEDAEAVLTCEAVVANGDRLYLTSTLEPGTYVVVESGHKEDGYLCTTTLTVGTATATGMTFTVEAGKRYDLTVDNVYTKASSIKKTASGLTETETVKYPNPTVSIYAVDADGNQTGSAVWTGVLTVNAEEAIYLDVALEAGRYIIVETNQTVAGYTCETSLTGGTAVNGLIFTVEDGKTYNLVVNNVYTQITDVTVSKTVPESKGDRDQAFSFTATIDQTADIVPNAIKSDGTPVVAPTYDSTTGKYIFTFTLKHDETVTFSNVVVGAEVNVTETVAPGYITSYTVGTVTADTKINYSNSATITASETAANNTVAFTNEAGQKLPSTGSTGTTSYTIGGLLTILATSIFLVYNNKKRRKEGRLTRKTKEIATQHRNHSEPKLEGLTDFLVEALGSYKKS